METIAVNWSDIKTTIQLPESKLDPETTARLQERMTALMEAQFAALFPKPPEPTTLCWPPRTASRGCPGCHGVLLHRSNCKFACCT